MYEYIIPQEFNQSDKLGKFTIPQAAILGAGVVLALFLFSTLSLLAAIPLNILIAVATVVLITKKVNNIPIYEFIFVYGMYRSMPKLLIYKKENIRDEFLEEIELYFEFDEDEK